MDKNVFTMLLPLHMAVATVVMKALHLMLSAVRGTLLIAQLARLVWKITYLNTSCLGCLLNCARPSNVVSRIMISRTSGRANIN
jgi:hypothetical protein